jgi:hypothetical protein
LSCEVVEHARDRASGSTVTNAPVLCLRLKKNYIGYNFFSY